MVIGQLQKPHKGRVGFVTDWGDQCGFQVNKIRLYRVWSLGKSRPLLYPPTATSHSGLTVIFLHVVPQLL